MSLFRKRGPTLEDVARENKVKRNLTKELSSSIRSLQRDHHKKDDVITSTDNANAVCNVLEAIFLHCLKSSVTKKLANYMSLNQTSDNSDFSVSFWQFAVKFTHSDVTSQLKRLGQVTTEIGLCRAWIRMALNDCLMESYVDAMLADKKTLEVFYHRTAYLHDLEQPEIFKSYLKGLMSFEFRLSYNSRILNGWSKTPLVLAGLLQPDNTPLPVISSPSEQRESSPDEKFIDGDISNGNESIDVRSIRTRSRGSSSENEAPVKPRTNKVKKSSKQLPVSSPESETLSFSSELSRSDVEKIRNLPRTSSAYDTGMSECSSSSHISCPDPVKYNENPVSYIENGNKDEMVFKLTEENEDSVSEITISNTPKNDSWDQLQTPASFRIGNSPEVDRLNNDVINSRILEDILNESDSECTNIEASDYFQKSGLPDLSATSDDIEDKLDSKSVSSTPEVNRQSTSTSQSPKPIDAKSNIPKVKGKKHRLKPDLSPPTKTAAAAELSPAVAIGIETAGSRSLRGRLSMPDIRAVTAIETRGRLGVIDARSEPDISGELSNNENGATPESPLGSPYAGNSLGAKSGWSSSFDLEALDTVQPLQTTSNDPVSASRPKSESFGSMLQNYTPSSSAMTSTSLDDVLQDLPSTSRVSPTKQHVQTDQDKNVDSVTCDDYEIVSAYSYTSLEKLDRNTEAKLALLREIACEKGLDAQNYQCGGCSRPVGLIYGNPRLCMFDGMYYCFECHENDEYYIPAYIVHNWDFRKHKVSKKNLCFLQDTEDQALINIAEINPKLYEHVQEMEDLRISRRQLRYLKTYLFTCKQSIAEEFRKSIWPKDYFYDSIDRYSLTDLLQVPAGQLQQSLKKVIRFASKHVYDCRLCSQKGFICELCNNPKVIYPFEIELTVQCGRCKSVFHKSCKTESRQCPKCQRRDLRKTQGYNEPQTPDSHDYAYSPHR